MSEQVESTTLTGQPMTPRQIELGRHALGLERRYKKSYRNRFFVAGLWHADHDDWMAMTDAGNALRWDGAKLEFGGDGADLFRLTRAGAEQCLRPGESLDPEDFPG